MSRRQDTTGGKSEGQHKIVALSLVGVVLLMTGLSFAAVPAYQLFCQVTGYGGTTQKAKGPADRVVDRKITVRFDSNTAPGLNWEFTPVQRTVQIKIGASALAFYQATNKATIDTLGTASFNVTPESAGAYFNKVACFCFTEQKLKAGQTVDMPVDFYIDPAILDNPETQSIKEITLSYTFFAVDDDNSDNTADRKSAGNTDPSDSSSGT